MMIYCGYENGHYYVRLTHDMRLVDAMCMFQGGYRMVMGYMLLIKRRETTSINTRKGPFSYYEANSHGDSFKTRYP